MPDSLRRLVDQGDRERARPSRIEPERLILAPRIGGKRRICWNCRLPATPETYRAAWLKEHPLPKRYCRDSRWCAATIPAEEDHRKWHEELHVSSQMPPFKEIAACPACGGRLVQVTM